VISEDRLAFMEKAADLATVFHWPLDQLENLYLHELDHWHKLAEERFRVVRGIV
jgi:hypothetical protein